jgi:excisionase family DNA binding protein
MPQPTDLAKGRRVPDIPVTTTTSSQAHSKGMNLIARHSIPSADRPATAQGAEVLNGRTPTDHIEVTITHADGTRQAAVLSPAAAEIIGDLLATLSVTEQVTLLADDAEVSPEDAAAILGISRPLVRRRMDSGRLPFRRVGSHRRLRLSDVLELKRAEAPVRQALGELQAYTDHLIAHAL